MKKLATMFCYWNTMKQEWQMNPVDLEGISTTMIKEEAYTQQVSVEVPDEPMKLSSKKAALTTKLANARTEFDEKESEIQRQLKLCDED